MSTLIGEMTPPSILHVDVSAETLSVQLSDERTLCVPLGWYPRPVHATAQERNRWELIGKGHGIHWPKLDEDISVQALLEGRPSAELAQSLNGWVAARGD